MDTIPLSSPNITVEKVLYYSEDKYETIDHLLKLERNPETRRSLRVGKYYRNFYTKSVYI